MKYFKIKLLDIVLIGLLILASFIPNAVFAYQAMSSPAQSDAIYVVIKIDSQEVERIQLDETKAAYVHEIVTLKGEKNTIRIDGGTVTMITADCPDQICVTAFPPISKDGEQIICLPHMLVVEVEGGDKAKGDLNAY